MLKIKSNRYVATIDTIEGQKVFSWPVNNNEQDVVESYVALCEYYKVFPEVRLNEGVTEGEAIKRLVHELTIDIRDTRERLNRAKNQHAKSAIRFYKKELKALQGAMAMTTGSAA